MSSVVYLLLNPPGTDGQFQSQGHTDGQVKLRDTNKRKRSDYGNQIGQKKMCGQGGKVIEKGRMRALEYSKHKDETVQRTFS